MQREHRAFLEDIINSIGKIERYCHGLSKASFASNELVQDAAIRNLEIIGEAVKKVPDEIKSKKTMIAWKKIAGLRDVLIHDYFGININIIWDVIENKLPELKAAVLEMLPDVERDN